jgi:GAF domain
MVAPVDLAGYRTIVSVPMLKDNDLIGAINIYRQEVCPFTDKQIDLVSNFASQSRCPCGARALGASGATVKGHAWPQVTVCVSVTNRH